jgi:Kae1-associated kinase Bud32
MIRAGGQIYFIDFGLGTFSHRLEDQGVDLNLLREALRATHFNIMRLCWRAIITGYRQEYAHADQALTKADEIERRARYMVRVQDL